MYRPAGLRPRAAAPVVLLLHGCGQTPAELVDTTGFVATADRDGVLLVLPHQSSRDHPQRCWRWYEAAHQHRGAGEPAVLAGLLGAVAAERVRWRADPRRVYVAGLSAGGAMALVLAATYPDLVAAAGAHSAPPYRSSTTARQALAAMAGRTPVPPPEPGAPAVAPVVVVHGGGDPVVRPVNGDRVVDQWLARRAAATDRDAPNAAPVDRGAAGGRTYRVRRWCTARGVPVLEHWEVDDLGHAWSGGRANGSFSDPAGPAATALMWTFLRRHRLDRRRARSPGPRRPSSVTASSVIVTR